MPQGLAWTTDIETHVDTLNKFFRAELTQHCPKKPLRPKKAFMTDELWALRRTKLCLRRRLQRSQRAASLETFARAFHGWRLQRMPPRWKQLMNLGLSPSTSSVLFNVLAC